MELDQELELVTKAKSDIRAFNILYEYYLPKILGYCINRVPRQEIAEDITSEVFLAAVKSIKSFDVKRRIRFGSWLFSVAHNKIVDFYRKNKKMVNMEIEDHHLIFSEEHDKEIAITEEQEKISKVLSKIKKRYQKIITYKYYTELDNTEIAQELKIKPNNVSVLLHRAMKAFKKEYAKNYPESEILEIY